MEIVQERAAGIATSSPSSARTASPPVSKPGKADERAPPWVQLMRILQLAGARTIRPMPRYLPPSGA